MAVSLDFPSQMLKIIIGGYSTIDVPRLDFHSLDEVSKFVKSYGYDLSIPEELDEAWLVFETSCEILEKYLLEPNEKIPEIIRSREKLEDIRRLFLYASTHDHSKNPMQMWSCAILRLMHCVAHVENDMFFNYTTEIQTQILMPIQERVKSLDNGTMILGEAQDSDQVPLLKFDTKAFKERHSMVIKTLSKPETVAIDIFDKIGLRFVTGSLIDAFRVVRYLRRENLISFANIVPNQSKNTLYPTNLFEEVLEEIKTKKQAHEPKDIEQALLDHLASETHRAKYKDKENPFTDDSYKVIKFVARKLVKVPGNSGGVKFFYPFEIQVVDYQTYVTNMAGNAAHGEYKLRQRKAARDRAMGELLFSPH